MGEARRRMLAGQSPINGKVQQFVINVEGKEPIPCSCGCVYFRGAAKLYKISAIESPTGQEMVVEQVVALCIACGKEAVRGEQSGKDEGQKDTGL